MTAGWHPDPYDPSARQLRWWDGTRWTEHVAPVQQQAAAPTSAQAPAPAPHAPMPPPTRSQPTAAPPSQASYPQQHPVHVAPATKRSRTGLILGIVALGLVVLVLGGAVALVALGGDSDPQLAAEDARRGGTRAPSPAPGEHVGLTDTKGCGAVRHSTAWDAAANDFQIGVAPDPSLHLADVTPSDTALAQPFAMVNTLCLSGPPKNTFDDAFTFSAAWALLSPPQGPAKAFTVPVGRAMVQERSIAAKRSATGVPLSSARALALVVLTDSARCDATFIATPEEFTRWEDQARALLSTLRCTGSEPVAIPRPAVADGQNDPLELGGSTSSLTDVHRAKPPCSINADPGWQPRLESDGGTAFAVAAGVAEPTLQEVTSVSGPVATLALVCVPVDGLRRRDARHAAFSQRELGASVGWKPEAMKRLVREGRPAALLESSHERRGTWTLQLFARGPTHQCIATFTGTVAEYDRLRSAVSASMETMRCEPPS